MILETKYFYNPERKFMQVVQWIIVSALLTVLKEFILKLNSIP